MGKFRKKPGVIEAWQFDGTFAGAQAIILLDTDHICFGGGETDGVLQIETLAGIMTAAPGDWIICGVNGEFYPCKPDIFAKTYEAVDE